MVDSDTPAFSRAVAKALRRLWKSRALVNLSLAF